MASTDTPCGARKPPQSKALTTPGRCRERLPVPSCLSRRTCARMIGSLGGGYLPGRGEIVPLTDSVQVSPSRYPSLNFEDPLTVILPAASSAESVFSLMASVESPAKAVECLKARLRFSVILFVDLLNVPEPEFMVTVVVTWPMGVSYLTEILGKLVIETSL